MEASVKPSTFAVSEVFPDGRVLVVVYVHVGDQITVVMDVYDDGLLQNGQRYLDLHLNNTTDLPTLNIAERQEET